MLGIACQGGVTRTRIWERNSYLNPAFELLPWMPLTVIKRDQCGHTRVWDFGPVQLSRELEARVFGNKLNKKRIIPSQPASRCCTQWSRSCSAAATIVKKVIETCTHFVKHEADEVVLRLQNMIPLIQLLTHGTVVWIANMSIVMFSLVRQLLAYICRLTEGCQGRGDSNARRLCVVLRDVRVDRYRHRS